MKEDLSYRIGKVAQLIAKSFFSKEMKPFRKRVKTALETDIPLKFEYGGCSSRGLNYKLSKGEEIMKYLAYFSSANTNKQRSVYIKHFLSRPEYSSFKVEDDGLNIIATKEGKKDSTVVFGAHYDIMDWGLPELDFLLKSTGAIDNGTGVCTVLKTAAALNDRNTKNTYKFIFFGKEELQLKDYYENLKIFDEDGWPTLGFLGSKHYLKNLSQEERDNILFMINADMLGKKSLHIDSASATKSLEDFVMRVADDDKPKLWKFKKGPSDHVIFRLYGIPSLMLCSPFMFFCSHSRLDRFKRVKPESLEKAHKLMAKIAYVTELNTSSF